MKMLEGGVTFPKGFSASGAACGLKKNGNKDLAVVFTKTPANAAGVFTKNVVKGHSLQLTRKNIECGMAQAVVINSGNANACVGEQGMKDAEEMAAVTAKLLDIDPKYVITGSTGVIGMRLNMDKIHSGVQDAVSQLSPDGSKSAIEAIMTTDTFPKAVAVEFDMDGVKVKIGAMAKGSGMIHPNMATMIGIVTTDAAIDSNLLKEALTSAVNVSFNRVSVDGDTSVCDMVVVLANGQSGNTPIKSKGTAYDTFVEALRNVCIHLSKEIARDGEGATKLVEISVEGAPTAEDAYSIVSAVAKSPLVKTAIFGEDANLGRVFTAAGYSGAEFNPDLVNIYIGDLIAYQNGVALPFDEVKAKEILSGKEVKIRICLNQGSFSDTIWTCDLSYDYVKINGSYRS